MNRCCRRSARIWEESAGQQPPFPLISSAPTLPADAVQSPGGFPKHMCSQKCYSAIMVLVFAASNQSKSYYPSLVFCPQHNSFVHQEPDSPSWGRTGT